MSSKAILQPDFNPGSIPKTTFEPNGEAINTLFKVEENTPSVTVGEDTSDTNISVEENNAVEELKEVVSEEITEIDALSARWAAERNQGEAFGDFVIRAGIVNEVKISIRDFYDD